MKSNFGQLFIDLRLPYLRSLLLISLVPLFPEYISFFLVIGAMVFALMDKMNSGAKWRLGYIGLGLLAYCVYMTFTCLISTQPLQSALVAAMWWFFFTVFLIVKNLLTNEDRMDAFLMCITAVAGLVGLVACIQYAVNLIFDTNLGSLWDFLDQPIFRLVPFNLTLTLDYGTRAYSTFANPNMTAQYLVMVIPFVVCFNFIQRRESLRAFARISLIFACAGVMLTFSRGGYMALIVLAVALVIINIRHHFATVLLYGAIALLFLPKQVFERLTSFDGGERMEIWTESLTRFLDKPLMGYGVGTDTTAAIFERIGIDAPHAHNLVLQLLLEGGVIALAIMLFIGVLSVRNGVRLLKGGYSKAFWVGFGVLGFAAAFCIHGLVDYALTVPRLICVFVTLLGITEQVPALHGIQPTVILKQRTIQVNS